MIEECQKILMEVIENNVSFTYKPVIVNYFVSEKAFEELLSELKQLNPNHPTYKNDSYVTLLLAGGEINVEAYEEI